MIVVRVAGVDGCPGGWVVVVWDTEAATLTPSVSWSFAELVSTHANVTVIGIDMPIGLAEGYVRGAERAARRFIGPRRSSVFPVPDRRLLGAGPYAETLVLARALTGKGLSRQAHAILPKIAEVDAVMTPALQRRIVEVHPEVSFAAMAGPGRHLAHPKKTAAGFAERRELLEVALGVPIWDRAEARTVARPAGADDVLDAAAAAWSAARFARGVAGRLPDIAEPEIDTRGLRMEIVY